MRIRIALVPLLSCALLGATSGTAPETMPEKTPPGEALPPPAPLGDDLKSAVTELERRAGADSRAFDVLASLTTEVGPRSAGSAGDRAAVAWALAELRELGFRNVRSEPVTVPHWDRGELEASIVAPFPQPMAAVALGGSVGTDTAGITAPVVAAADLDELASLSPEQVRGHIVYLNGRMERARDGSGYGTAVKKRSRGAIEAAKLGAVGVVIRSVGTDRNRLAHTGAMRYDDAVPRIPAIAISNPDADVLDRQIASGREVVFHMRSTARTLPDARSANVIGEIPGRDEPERIVLLGAHLDSWDLGTGAEDDGAGVAIVVAAARLVGDAPRRPRRTIRVVLYANEEFGLSGGRAYAEAHAAEIDRHVVAMEADMGAGRVWRFASRVPPDRLPAVAALEGLIEPLGPIEWHGNEAYGGADIGPLMRRGVPVLQPTQDASEYFDIHHTANDTLDKIDPVTLRQNVAVYAALAYAAAEADLDLGRLPATEESGDW